MVRWSPNDQYHALSQYTLPRPDASGLETRGIMAELETTEPIRELEAVGPMSELEAIEPNMSELEASMALSLGVFNEDTRYHRPP